MGSWGRHGWPKTNEGLRIYRERDGSYFLLDPKPGPHGYDGIANVLTDPTTPSLGSTTVGRTYIYERGCKRVQWSEVPPRWRKAFRSWINGDPRDIRGFWLVGQQPTRPVRKGDLVVYKGRRYTIARRKRNTHPLAGPQKGYTLFLSRPGVAPANPYDFVVADEPAVALVR